MLQYSSVHTHTRTHKHMTCEDSSITLSSKS